MPSQLSLPVIKDLDDQARVQLLATSPESQWLERKSAAIKADDLANVIIGMANAEGGLIVLGIRDGKVEGVARGDQNGWRQASRDFVVPPARITVTTFPCTLAAGNPGEVVVVDVEASETVHHNRKEEVFLRVGDETRRLNAFEAQELIFDKGQSNFDMRRVSDATFDDLDPVRLQQYLRRVNARTSSPEILEARGLMSRGVPTSAGILVLGLTPQRFFPEAYVRVLQYRDTARAVGSRANVTFDRRIEGAIPQQIDAVRKLVKRRLPTAIRLGLDARFGATRLLPDDAWLEAIVNAVVHRSYSMAGDHIRVEIYPDRLEVESPGRLPGLVRVDNIRSARFARNPRIARAIADFGFGRELGEGVDRMFEEMRRAGLPDPEYVQFSSAVRVRLRFDPLADANPGAVSPLASEIYRLLLQTNRATTAELATQVGRSRPTVLQGLRTLEEAGLIQHVGTSPKDSRGYWQLAPRA